MGCGCGESAEKRRQMRLERKQRLAEAAEARRLVREQRAERAKAKAST